MKRYFVLCVFLCSVLNAQSTINWPGFRGDGNSLTTAHLPLTWSNEKNIAWRLPLEGYGQSSPIIWENKVFVTYSSGEMKENLVIACIDLLSGKTIWNKKFTSSFPLKRNNMSSQSAPTPISDGKNIYTFFENGEIIALSHEGKELWNRNLAKEFGAFKGNHGVGSSLAQTDDTIIVLIDHDGPSYLLSIQKKTGETKWKLDREARVSWSSPIIANDQIIISSNGIVEAYNAHSGKRIWYVDEVKSNTVASPSYTEDIIVIGSSVKGYCMAIKRNGNDNAKDNILWTADATCSFASPLIYKDNVYFVNRSGVLICVDAKTGEKHWSERLPAAAWASPIAVNDHLYFFCKEGTTVVAKADSEKFTPIAHNPVDIGTNTLYGVATTNESLLLRTGMELICIRETQNSESANK